MLVLLSFWTFFPTSSQYVLITYTIILITSVLYWVLMSGSVRTTMLFFFFKLILVITGPLCSHTHSRISLSTSISKSNEKFYLECLESIDQLRETRHLYNIEYFNLRNMIYPSSYLGLLRCPSVMVIFYCRGVVSHLFDLFLDIQWVFMLTLMKSF